MLKKKNESPCRAEELYVSPWFRKARGLVKATGYPWFIISAKHRLLDPGKRIKPYDQTLNRMPTGKRKEWAEKVISEMDDGLPNANAIVILAGEKYREYLMPYLEERFTNVMIPMKGLRIGEQLKWLNEARIKDILPP